MRPDGRNILELLRALRVTLIVFVTVVVSVCTQREVVARWLASMDGFQTTDDAANLPLRFWLVIALRLGVFAAAVPLAAEGWVLVCRLRRAPAKMWLWPAFCAATIVALAGAFALTRQLAGELRRAIVYFSDARAPISRPDHRVPRG